MDETPIRAGRAEPGKMKGGYFWPIYGELDEVCFPFFDGRGHACVERALGLTPVERGVLLSDGYAAYAQYAAKTGLTHAQCWAHTRRKFIEAERAEPTLAAQALDQIGAIYAIEAQIRERRRTGERKREDRLLYSKPLVEKFFAWVQTCFDEHGLLPTSPMTRALAYARERRLGLEVFLTDPDVLIDTNHLERALRAIPMGRNYPRSIIRQGLLAPPPRSLDPTRVSARIAVGKPDIRNGVSCGSDPSPQEHIHVYGYLPDELCSSRLAD